MLILCVETLSGRAGTTAHDGNCHPYESFRPQAVVSKQGSAANEGLEEREDHPGFCDSERPMTTPSQGHCHEGMPILTASAYSI